MYIFSMPTDEALTLGGYDRYHKTITLYLYGIVTIMCLRFSIDWKGIDSIKTLLMSIVLIVFAFISLKYGVGYSQIFYNNDYSTTARYQIKQLKDEYNIADDKKYLIYTGDPIENSSYIFYAIRYEFRTNNISVYNSEEIKNQNLDFNNYDYIISLEKDSTILSVLKDHGINKYQEVIKLR